MALLNCRAKTNPREATSIVTGQPLDVPASGVSAKFGYYPAPCDIQTVSFSVQTLPDHRDIVTTTMRAPNVHNDWIYSGGQQQRDFMTGNVRSSRVFRLPKTHVLTLHKSESQEELNFVVWCLSFFTGMRLTTAGAGFLDATPIKPGKLVDFSLNCCTLEDAIQLALNYLESERSVQRVLRRVEAAIHALFLAQYPQNLPFEQFQYLYMALDTCFSLVKAKCPNKLQVTHADRIPWMCETFGLPVPEWATGKESLSTVRNDAFHEALFFDQPLGFAIYGGNQSAASQSDVILQMQALICRLLVAILGKPGISYVRTPVDTRQCHALELGT